SFPHAAVFTVTWSPGTAEEGYTSRASAAVPAGMPDRWSAGAAYAGATSTPAAATASTVPVSGRAEPRIDAPSSSRTGRGPRHPHVPPSIASLLSEVSATRPGPLPEGVSEGGLNGCQGERAGPGARRVSAGHRRRRGPAGADPGKDAPRDGERVTGPPALVDGPGAAPRRAARRHYRAARGGGPGAGAGADRGAAGAVGRRDVRARPVLRGDAEQRGRRRSPVPRRQHRRGRGGTSPADAPRRDVLPAPRLPGDPELRAAAGLP